MTPIAGTNFPTTPTSSREPSSADCGAALSEHVGALLQERCELSDDAGNSASWLQPTKPSKPLMRRVRYIARFIYWSARHRSFKHADWVCEYEGYTWN